MKKLAFLLTIFLLTLSVFAQETYYVSARTARVRSCPETSCSIVARLRRGTAVQVLETVEGDAVSGNTTWYRIEARGREGYIHSSLVTTTPPVTQSSSGNSPAASSTPQEGSIQAISTPVPQPPQTGATCGGATTCGQMASCDQAYACLRDGRTSLDRDNDGIPCESICGG